LSALEEEPMQEIRRRLYRQLRLDMSESHEVQLDLVEEF